MNDPKPLYRGLPASARSLGEYLEARGVGYLLEDHDEIGVRSRARKLSRQTLLVESDQFAHAAALRDEWLASSAVRARGLSRRLGTVFVLSLAVPAAWLAGWYVVGEPIPAPEPQWVFLAWVVSVVVLAQIEARRRTAERIEMPDSGAT